MLSDSANCTVLRAVELTQYRRVTDGQTDGIAVASTALAKRRAVKMNHETVGRFVLNISRMVWSTATILCMRIDIMQGQTLVVKNL